MRIGQGWWEGLAWWPVLHTAFARVVCVCVVHACECARGRVRDTSPLAGVWGRQAGRHRARPRARPRRCADCPRRRPGCPCPAVHGAAAARHGWNTSSVEPRRRDAAARQRATAGDLCGVGVGELGAADAVAQLQRVVALRPRRAEVALRPPSPRLTSSWGNPLLGQASQIVTNGVNQLLTSSPH